MAKTVFVQGTPVPASWFNALNGGKFATGRDEDGEGALPYAVDTGAANAYVVTLAPALPAYITGMLIQFKAAAANTGASTININGLGAVAIKKRVNAALTANDIMANQIVTMVYDGTNFQLVSFPGPAGEIVGTTDAQTLSAKTLATPTITQPTIADFTSASHNHSGGVQGGKVSGQLGAWEAKSVNTVYYAATDGFIVTQNTSASGITEIYTDASNPPTTLRTVGDDPAGPGEGVCCPIKKGDYYKVANTDGTITIYWIPLGA